MDNDFTFAQPLWLCLLLLLPLLVFLRARPARRRGLTVGNLDLVRPVAHRARLTPFGPSWSWLLPAFFLAVLAMARPQRIDSETEREFSGVQIVIALDVSRSMTAQDFRLDGSITDRLTAAKAVCQEFIDTRPHDRIGAYAFAGVPYLISVPIMDHDWVKKNIERADIGLVEDGTAIGSAIAAATTRLDKQSGNTKILVLITDGKSNGGQLTPIDAARQAAALGIRIYTVAVGREGESTIRVPSQFGGERWARIINEFDPKTLAKIAEISGGSFYRADGTRSLRKAFRNIDELEKSRLLATNSVRREDLFHWFLIPALLFAVADLFFPSREERALPA